MSFDKYSRFDLVLIYTFDRIKNREEKHTRKKINERGRGQIRTIFYRAIVKICGNDLVVTKIYVRLELGWKNYGFADEYVFKKSAIVAKIGNLFRFRRYIFRV